MKLLRVAEVTFAVASSQRFQRHPELGRRVHDRCAEGSEGGRPVGYSLIDPRHDSVANRTEATAVMSSSETNEKAGVRFILAEAEQVLGRVRHATGRRALHAPMRRRPASRLVWRWRTLRRTVLCSSSVPHV
jgi:hypothetical protein